MLETWLLPPFVKRVVPAKFSYATLVLASKRSGGLTYFSLTSPGDLYSRIGAVEGYMPARGVKFWSTLALEKRHDSWRQYLCLYRKTRARTALVGAGFLANAALNPSQVFLI